MAKTLKITMAVDYRNTKGINSKTLKKLVVDTAGDQLATYQSLNGPGWFQKTKLDEIFFTGSQNLIPLGNHFEATVIDPLLAHGDIITGNVKLYKYTKVSSEHAVFSFAFSYRQKHCVNETKLVIRFNCLYVMG